MLDQTEPLKDGETCFWLRQDQEVRKLRETAQTTSGAKQMVL